MDDLKDLNRNDAPIWIDLNARVGGDLYSLNKLGTRDDLRELGIQLREGLRLTFHMDGELYEGTVSWHSASHQWVVELTYLGDATEEQA